jgi:MoxR-like ATPase
MSELKELEKSVQDIIAGLNKLKQEIKKVIVGQEEIIDQLLITF